MDQAQRMFLKKFQLTFAPIEQASTQYFTLDEITWKITGQTDVLTIMSRAISHLASHSDTRSHATINIYTGSSHKIATFLAWLEHSYPKSLVRVNCDEYACYYNPGLEGAFASLNFLDKKTGQATYWVRSVQEIPWYEIAAPFRIILRWVFAAQGYILLHAACVSRGGVGALIVGRGGKGKTTTALTSMVTSGLAYVSDDYTLVKIKDVVTAYSLYSSAKVRRAPGANGENAQDKAVRFILEEDSTKLAKETRIIALLTPVIGHTQTTWKRISSGEALLTIAPSTLIQLFPEDTGTQGFGSMVELVKKVDAYTLAVGPDSGEIGQKLVAFLQPPQVSVILPTYNTASYILEALESVKRAIGDQDAEIIVVDDGSTDNTKAIVRAAWGNRLIYLSQTHSGPSTARNRGLTIARGEYIAFIDADDVWTDDHLRYLKGVMQQPPACMVVMGYSQRHTQKEAGVPLTQQPLYGVPVHIPSFGCALFRRAVFSKIGKLNEDYRWHEDVDWYLRLREANMPPRLVSRVVKHYRIHANNMTKNWTPTNTKMLTVLARSLKRRSGAPIPTLTEYKV